MRSDGEVVISTKLDTKSFEKQIEEVEYELKQIDYELSHKKELKLDKRSISEYTKRAEILNNKLIDLRKRQDELNRNNFFGNIKGSIDGVIKKITKWGLAIFGIRSAYMAVRRAASTVSQYNEQIKTDLAYIQYSLATALEPIIKTVIDLAYKLLNVINAISIAMFNYNIFQNASVDKFKKMNAGANQLKKTLSGFDEMNILQDTNGGANTTLPSGGFDTTEGEKFKSFWNGIIKFWEEDWKTAFANIGGNWQTFIDGILYIGKGFYDFFKGIIELIKGVWNSLVALFKGDSEGLYNAWVTLINGFKDIFSAIIEFVAGIFLTAIGIIKGILLDLVQGIYNKVIVPIGNFFANMWKGVSNGAVSAWNGIKKAFSSVVSFFSNIVNKIFGFFKKIGSTAGNVVASAFKAVVNAVLRTIENILNTPIRAINGLIDTINQVPGINLGKLSTFNLPRLAKGGIVNMPGRGVPIGGAITGEHGAEGVIPLTDSQQMAILGEAIGKYININATVPVYVGNRQIAREIRKINAEDNFAFNR